MRVKMKKIAGAGLTSLALVVGVAGFAGASSGTIGTTGPDSNNEIKNETSTSLRLNNHNNVNLAAQTHQHASSGDAVGVHNTTVGNVETGNTANTSSVSADVSLSNTQSTSSVSAALNMPASDTGSVNNTGPDSNNKVTFENHAYVNVDNHNDVDIHNSVDQSATSGNAIVHDNTTGGNAVTGSATNDSTTSFTVSVSN